MSTKIKYILFVFVFLTTGLQAQLSPGKLTKAHAELEGISNCTQCHTLGNKVEDKKCLECHDEIQIRMDRNQGFHSSSEVKGKDCATCHSEHHGRNFDMMRFDQDNFDHDITGYELTGAHDRIDCRDCHMPDFIADSELKKRKNTFLGLDQDCVSCHEDVHQNTLSTNDCTKCHSTEEFAPAEFFDHDDTDYPLNGKHVDVECIECHQKEVRNGKEFQRFANVEFKNCNSCHDDVHDNNLGTNCKQCHHESSFNSLRRVKKFNHDRYTNFPLKGAHQEVDCAGCHNMDAPPETIFQDQNGVTTNDCISCHDDVHDGKFGTNCVDCHNEESFYSVRTDEFNHNLTDFPLVGKHQVVECRECHTQSLTAPLEYNRCMDCHDDYHEGDFTKNGVTPDCNQCHTEDGFAGSSYTIEQHNETAFPLEGGHIATPCFACHLSEDEKWRFKDIGERCVDCHEDVHQGYIAEEYYPEQNCEACHVVDNWELNHFDHQLTGWELLGQHANATCMDCHTADESAGLNRYDGFLNSPRQCIECHENVHDDQFEIEGITDCARCHSFNDWTMNNFDHDQTAFKLEGAHEEVACEACHQPMQTDDGRTIIQYKFNSFECIDCHQ